MRATLSVNGRTVQVDAPAGTMLLEVLRDQLGLLGARGTCGVGLCGACTVLLDGEPASSCILFAALADGRQITTIEGVAADDPVVTAFDRVHAFQCGYCIPGVVLTAKALLAAGDRPGREAIAAALGGNLCRCGCYGKILDAIEQVADEGRPCDT